MTLEKSVNLFLLDGSTTGKIKCTMQNRTGIVYKIPRNLLDSCYENKNLATCMNQTGVYFLIGENIESSQKVIYIGQATTRKNGKSFSQRLHEHKKNPEKDYWNEAIIVTTQNDSLGLTDISYLENKFYTMACEAGRYLVKNDDDPNPGNITEEKESELEEFSAYAKIMVGVLGHNAFEPVIINESPKLNNPIFHFKGKYDASATINSEGFMLLKNSNISLNIQKCAKESVRKKRGEYKNQISKEGVTLADIPFSSPSAAASFVSGCSSSGNASWFTSEGKKPKDLNI